MSAELAGLSSGRRRLLVGLVVALGAALGLALLVIAFLLGRLSVTAELTARRPTGGTTESVRPQTPEAPAQSTPFVERDAEGGSGPEAGSTPRGGVASPPSSASPKATAIGTGSPERGRIASYFQEVERLEDMGAGDPQAFAKSLMESVTSGDFSGFDALLARARTQQDRLRSIEPPSACAEHHRLASVLARDSVSLMERLKAALMNGDAAGLMAMSSEGRALEARADELRTLAATIRRQAGL